MSIAHMGGKKGGAILLGMADNEPEDSTSMVHGKMNKSRKMCLKKCKKNHKCNKKCLKRMGSRKNYRGGVWLFNNKSDVDRENQTNSDNNDGSSGSVFFKNISSVLPEIKNPFRNNDSAGLDYSAPPVVSAPQDATQDASAPINFKNPLHFSKGGKKSRRKPRKSRKNKSRRRKY